MIGAREILMVLMAWIFQIGFFIAIAYAIYKINNLHRDLQDLRDDVKSVRQRLEEVPPVQ